MPPITNAHTDARPTRPVWTLCLTGTAYFMVVLDTLVVITALPRMQEDLGISLGTLQWSVNAYGIAFAAGIITAAALGDRLGRRRVFVGGLALFTLASGVCALAPGAATLIAARAVQGLGGAAVLPLSLTILIEAFPLERRGSVLGIYTGIAGLAVAVGPLVGGIVTDGLDWRWIFWINLPIGVGACLLSLLRLPESRGPRARLDLLGLGLISTAVVALVWGLVRTGEGGWWTPEVTTALLVGAYLLTLFFWWEARTAEPMLPPRLLRIRAFVAGNATAFLMSAAGFATGFLVTEYFQFGLGYSPFWAGLRLLPLFVTPMFVAPLAGALADRIGMRPVIVAGQLLQAVGLVWIALAAGANAAYVELAAALCVTGIGLSLTLPTIPAVVMGGVPEADVGKASGVNTMMQRFGAVFGVAVASAVFAANGTLHTPAGVADGFSAAAAVCAAFSLAGGVSAFLIVSRRRPLDAPSVAPAMAHARAAGE